MKKLLVITGAGASLEFGMPSVNQIDTLLEEWSKIDFPLHSDTNKSLYSWVKEMYSNYLAKNKLPRHNNFSFEDTLFLIQNISALGKDELRQQFKNPLNGFLKMEEFPEITSFGSVHKANSDDFYFLHSRLVDKLVQHFRVKCATLSNDKRAELDKLISFFKELKKDFSLGFINLNYDNVILSALPDLTTGFESGTGEFNRSTLYKDDWNFCYHLHGSIHFDMQGDGEYDMHKIKWNNDIDSIFSQNSSGRNSNSTREGLSHLTSSIITGLDKTNQLLREPFGQYFMQIDRLIYEADSILFIGYGFSDSHLNSFFPFIRWDKVKTRKVVVIDWASNHGDCMHFRGDDWSNGVFKTIPVNGFEMGDGNAEIPYSIQYYKDNCLFEKSMNPKFPLAIWYGGLLEACKYPNKILQEL